MCYLVPSFLLLDNDSDSSAIHRIHLFHRYLENENESFGEDILSLTRITKTNEKYLTKSSEYKFDSIQYIIIADRLVTSNICEENVNLIILLLSNIFRTVHLYPSLNTWWGSVDTWIILKKLKGSAPLTTSEKCVMPMYTGNLTFIVHIRLPPPLAFS